MKAAASASSSSKYPALKKPTENSPSTSHRPRRKPTRTKSRRQTPRPRQEGPGAPRPLLLEPAEGQRGKIDGLPSDRLEWLRLEREARFPGRLRREPEEQGPAAGAVAAPEELEDVLDGLPGREEELVGPGQEGQLREFRPRGRGSEEGRGGSY